MPDRLWRRDLRPQHRRFQGADRKSCSDLTEFRGHTPVLIDDIVSSGRTMTETARQLRQRGLAAPVCIAVHGLFTPDTERELLEVAARVVTTNTVPHYTNGIDLSQAITEQVAALC